VSGREPALTSAFARKLRRDKAAFSPGRRRNGFSGGCMVVPLGTAWDRLGPPGTAWDRIKFFLREENGEEIDHEIHETHEMGKDRG
jgi:hypothetical protein